MFSSNELDALMARIISQLGLGAGDIHKILSANGSAESSGNRGNQKTISNFSPQKVLVILGMLAGVLEVKSILVDRDQVVNILLEGSLKRKTPLDNCLDTIGAMPFDDVLRAVMGRL